MNSMTEKQNIQNQIKHLQDKLSLLDNVDPVALKKAKKALVVKLNQLGAELKKGKTIKNDNISIYFNGYIEDMNFCSDKLILKSNDPITARLINIVDNVGYNGGDSLRDELFWYENTKDKIPEFQQVKEQVEKWKKAIEDLEEDIMSFEDLYQCSFEYDSKY